MLPRTAAVLLLPLFAAPARFAAVASASVVDCGEGRCFNGGTCLGQTVGDRTVYSCDCTSTYASGSAFAGRYCQYEATTFCQADAGSSVKLFCVNGGTCRADPYSGCDCADPYTGFACEYKIPEVQSGNDDEGLDTIVNQNSGQNGGQSNGNSGNNWPDPVDPTGTDDDHGNGNTATEAPTQADSALDDQPTNPGGIVYDDDGAQGDNGNGNGAADDGRGGGTDDDQFDDDKSGGTDDDQYDDDDGAQDDGQHTGDFTMDKINYNDHDYFPDDAGDYDDDSSTLPPVNDIDICTTDGSTLDATPLSFCVNGGTCLRRVTTQQGHAGCQCPRDWTGPHCEISIAVANASWEKRIDLKSANHALRIAVIFLALLVATILTAFAVSAYCRSRRRRQSRLRWGGAGYSDDKANLNLAPRRSFYEAEDASDAAAAAAPPPPVSSARDPMAQLGHLNGGGGAGAAAFAAESRADRSIVPVEPQVYIGPPRDEDGHVLHSVEIL